ncbi:MAG: hypothetical protein ACJ75T_12420 [Solirubrobacterales bacterium]
MLTRLRDQIGTAGLIVAIVALVAALGGGAYAASKGLNSTQKKEVNKIAKSFQGTGPQGAAGPAGAPGAAGAKGDTGAAGTNGQAGVSPVGTKFTTNKNGCPSGGIEYKGANTNSVCNGAEGPEGSPWTVDGVLPPGATETGNWGAFSPFSYQEEEPVGVKISFPLPVPASAGAGTTEPPTHAAVQQVFINPEEDKSAQGCPGYVEGIPTADPGKLCVYADAFERGAREGFWYSTPTYTDTVNGLTTGGSFEGVGTTGTMLALLCEDECFASGNWAVTAP